MTGVLFASPGGGTAWTFSVIFKIVGAAAIAPTAAAPTAVFCRKPRLDIFDFFSSAIRFPSVLMRERTPTHFLGGRTASKDISTCVTSRVTKRKDTTIGRPIQPDDVGCRGGDSNPVPSDASGAPRSGYGRTL